MKIKIQINVISPPIRKDHPPRPIADPRMNPRIKKAISPVLLIILNHIGSILALAVNMEISRLE